MVGVSAPDRGDSKAAGSALGTGRPLAASASPRSSLPALDQCCLSCYLSSNHLGWKRPSPRSVEITQASQIVRGCCRPSHCAEPCWFSAPLLCLHPSTLTLSLCKSPSIAQSSTPVLPNFVAHNIVVSGGEQPLGNGAAGPCEALLRGELGNREHAVESLAPSCVSSVSGCCGTKCFV